MAEVLKGQRATFSDDKKTITTRAYPKKSGYAYKIQEKTWKNYCPLCKKSGTLTFNPKKAPEAELTCGNGHPPHYGGGCDADFCCVSGLDTHSGKPWGKLTPATATPNKRTKVASSKTKSQKCSMTRAEAKTKAKQSLNTKTDFKATLEISNIGNLKTGDLCEVSLDKFPKTKGKALYIDKMKEDIDNQTLTLDLIEGKNHYSQTYDGQDVARSKDGAILGNSKSNPLNAKCSNVNLKIGLKADSKIAKKILHKGQELGTIKKCYKWLRIKSAGGTGGWKYKKYENHIVKSEKYNKFGEQSAKKCWDSKTANCCDFSWLFAMLTKGATGKPAGIRKGTYTLNGKTNGHMWNYSGTKTYDCSSNAKKSIEMKKIEKVS